MCNVVWLSKNPTSRKVETLDYKLRLYRPNWTINLELGYNITETIPCTVVREVDFREITNQKNLC